MKSKKKYRSIRKRLVTFYLITAIVSIVTLGTISYAYTASVIKEKSSVSYVQTLSYVMESIDNQMDALTQVADEVFVNKSIKNVLNKADINNMEFNYNLRYINEFYNSFKSYSSVESYVSSIIILGDNNKVVKLGDYGYTVSEENLKNSEYYKKARELDGKILWTGTHEDWATFNDYKYTISAVRLLKDDNFQEGIGMAFLSFKESAILDQYKNIKLPENSYIFVIDEHGNVISHKDRSLINTNLSNKNYIKNILAKNYGYITADIEGTKMLVTYYTSSKNGWKVIEVTPMKSLVNESKVIGYVTILVSFICILLGGIFFWIISSKITNPIKKLKDTMKVVEKGNFAAKADEKELNEIGDLGHSFNFMIDEIKALIERSLKEEREKKDANYKALIAQINPHFLYNTLNSIKWMAIMQKADNIKNMTTSLGRLLQKSIKNIDNFVAIEEELSLVEDYLYIEKLRYDDKVNIEYIYDSEILKFYTPKFILQPAIENAIFHGIEPKSGTGNIVLEIKQEEKKIIFTVADNGVGMNEEKIYDLINEGENKIDGFSGIGIKNVNQRIKQLFGEEFGIHIDSTIGQGTKVKITIPLIKEYEKNTKGKDEIL